jgi:hypothetical protein
MKDEYKPCPICGGKLTFVIAAEDPHHDSIQCTNCMWWILTPKGEH